MENVESLVATELIGLFWTKLRRVLRATGEYRVKWEVLGDEMSIKASRIGINNTQCFYSVTLSLFPEETWVKWDQLGFSCFSVNGDCF